MYIILIYKGIKHRIGLMQERRFKAELSLLSFWFSIFIFPFKHWISGELFNVYLILLKNHLVIQVLYMYTKNYEGNVLKIL